jgi:hypothetical protein
MKSKTPLILLRIAYWLGIVLDALAFVQMAFPAVGKCMLQVERPLGPEYAFAINLGAGLMLAWTLLLFWADRKPVERRTIIPLTMIVVAWNVPTLIGGVRAGLLPARAILPQLIALFIVFVYYGLCYVLVSHGKAGKGEGINSSRVSRDRSPCPR